MVNIAEIKRQMFKERLEKAFGSEEIEKARHGVYTDTAENRAKQRVGQEYGQAAQPQEPGEKRQPKGSEEGGGDIKSYASNASDEALKRAAADKNAKPEVREAAKNELANRNGGNDKKSEPVKKEEKKDADSASNTGSDSSIKVFVEKQGRNKYYFIPDPNSPDDKDARIWLNGSGELSRYNSIPASQKEAYRNALLEAEIKGETKFSGIKDACDALSKQIGVSASSILEVRKPAGEIEIDVKINKDTYHIYSVDDGKKTFRLKNKIRRTSFGR